ncbi:F-box only protein 6-like isoform X2 [Ornithodoros turicata]
MSAQWEGFPFFSLQDSQDIQENEHDCGDSQGFPILHLPDNVVAHILSFLSINTLLRQCRYVCQTFRNLIDGHALWKAKCIRERKTIPNYRFNAPPQKYYQMICRYNPYGVNLVKNACGQTGPKKQRFKYWQIESNGGDKWGVECPPKGADATPTEDQHCFATSYGLCSKVQVIDLCQVGVLPEVMDLIKPPIHISEWHAARVDCGCIYRMDVTLLNHKGAPLASFSTGIIETEQRKGREWKQVQHVFSDYPEGVR